MLDAGDLFFTKKKKVLLPMLSKDKFKRKRSNLKISSYDMSYVEMRQTLSEIVLCLWKQGENNMKQYEKGSQEDRKWESKKSNTLEALPGELIADKVSIWL